MCYVVGVLLGNVIVLLYLILKDIIEEMILGSKVCVNKLKF